MAGGFVTRVMCLIDKHWSWSIHVLILEVTF